MGAFILDYFKGRFVIFVIAVAVLGLGMAAGAVAVGVMEGDIQAELNSFLSDYVHLLGDGPVAATGAPEPAASALRGAFLPWLLGLSVIGGPFVLALLFLRGFALGFTLGFLIESLAYRGFLLSFAGILPHAVFFVPALILAAGSSLAFSLAATKALAGGRSQGGLGAQFAVATVACALAGILLAVGSWVQANLSPILAQTLARYVAIEL